MDKKAEFSVILLNNCDCVSLFLKLIYLDNLLTSVSVLIDRCFDLSLPDSTIMENLRRLHFLDVL